MSIFSNDDNELIYWANKYELVSISNLLDIFHGNRVLCFTNGKYLTLRKNKNLATLCLRN